ncbi:hypothetical protein A6764_15725 [Brevibacillus sp. WF146]|uniref:hypothetical protein n=1 Tax=Brevibacillus sp. WF146 TaxID=319501 RepID=UPI000A8A7873|nr:hypothetical protein [Brevibacillus sp. WF146]UYZ12261.1 hypothetical protein A6764_15725 [Brevibacillus sp. WF146]
MKPVERVTPGTKVYKLFEHEQCVCEGKDEVFLISVKRLSREEYERSQRQKTASR